VPSPERGNETITPFRHISQFQEGRLNGYVNRLFDVTADTPALSSPFDHLFSNETRIDPEARLAELKRRMASGEAVKVGPADIVPMIWEGADKSIPEVERFPANYYEYGIEQLHFLLQVRQRLTCEHWKRNTGFSFVDIVHLISESSVAGIK
jgi:hypothetical protein